MNYLNSTQSTPYKNKNIVVRKSSTLSRALPTPTPNTYSSVNQSVPTQPVNHTGVYSQAGFEHQQFVDVSREIQKKSNSQHYLRGFISGTSLALIMFIIVTASFPMVSNLGLAAIACIILFVI